MTIFVYVGNTAPSIQDNLQQVASNGSIIPIPLAGVDVNFRMRSMFGSTVLVDGDAVIVGDAANGQVRYDWSLADTTTAIGSRPGPYLGWWHLDYGDDVTLDTTEFPVQFLDHSTRRGVGPCTDWCGTQDVSACYPDVTPGACLNSAVTMASELLFELSGRQFPGWCQSVIRPCQNNCWGSLFGPQFLDRGHVVWSDRGWRDASNEPCNCGSWLQKVNLPGIAQEIVEVLIGGAVLDPSAYRLDPDNVLLRTDGGAWPICQNMAAAPTDPGTFQITYGHGYLPTELGRRAAAQLAREFWIACPGSGAAGLKCLLPAGVVEVTRQGIKVTRTASLMFQSGATGLTLVDSFLAAYSNKPSGLVMSPDTMPTDRRTG
jgi:hypothetical protein